MKAENVNNFNINDLIAEVEADVAKGRTANTRIGHADVWAYGAGDIEEENK